MTCPECSEKNNPEASFCVRCGARLKKYCTSCGAEVDGLNFCGSCGVSVGGSRPAAPKVSDFSLPDLGSYRVRWYLFFLLVAWTYYFLPRDVFPDLIRFHFLNIVAVIYIAISLLGNRVSFSKLIGPINASLNWGDIIAISISWVALTSGTLSVITFMLDTPQVETRLLVGNANLFIYLVILAPIIEEVIFRGLLLNRLTIKYGAVPGIGLSALAFMAMHLFTGILMWPSQFIFGFISGCLYLRSKTLVSTVALHSIANFLNFFIIIFFQGDPLDLQYGIVALVISTPVLIFYIVRWWPKIRVNDVPV